MSLNVSEAILSAQRYIRAFLTQDLIQQALLISASAHDRAAVVDLILWLLVINGSAASRGVDKEHWAGLIRGLIPNAVEVSYGEVRKLGLKLPWIETGVGSSTEEFWGVVGCGGGESLEGDFLSVGENGAGKTAWLIQGYASVTSTPKPRLPSSSGS